MSKTKIILSSEVYNKHSAAQSSQAFTALLQTLANRAINPPRNIKRPKRIQPNNEPPISAYFLSRALGIPSQNTFFDQGPPYTSGSPNPESAVKTGGTAQGAYYNIEALGDNSTGHLSVGVSAGITRNADWTGGTYYSLLPGRWMWGDCVQTSASIQQAIDLPKGLQGASTLGANISLSWDAQYPGSSSDPNFILGMINDALYNVPGLADSPMGGFVGGVVAVDVNVSLVSESAILASSQTSTDILSFAIDAAHIGDTVQDQGVNPYLWFEFAFADSPWAPINLMGSVRFANGAKQMIVEANVRLVGARGGVDDPKAGYVTVAYQNLFKGASPVSFVPGRCNPFLLSRITAFYI